VKLVNLAGILAASAALALYASWAFALREPRTGGPVDASAVAGIPLLRLPEAQALWQDRLTLFVDVRSAGDYDVGHIAGAINLPEEEFEKYFPLLRSRLEHARAIVVYCKSRDCAKSLWSAIRLHQEGLTQTKIYPNGWNEWFTNSLPSASPTN
jgi:rhodanese-related sulfurtransferase